MRAVHCPNCGTGTSSDQKFCRSCGLALEKVAALLAEQLPAIAAGDEGLRKRKHRVEVLLTILVGGMIGIFLISIIWAIVFKIIIGKGDVLEGSIFLGFIIAAAVALALVFYRESLLEKSSKPQPTRPPQIPETAAAKGLPEPSFEPAASVTDRTTELLVPNSRASDQK